ncbi:uncharacterized protein LOC112345397 [Selaginella moellendorffii]|uniref:uncharacterized protein LOC112345397 n=1 Tax=Selaginella moellendorffii TaxID=88036 RepID=UPI000D1C7420|nr:uncharacterized protein LOC112345397 [Selaginella moellendorffii]|eukprot:XP_024527856.1 uncharacterized protein LOC112345397 [Selaginella moellendorffii]
MPPALCLVPFQPYTSDGYSLTRHQHTATWTRESRAWMAYSPERVWDAPGRGTAAGRALFRLYNGFAAARQKGEQFSLQNRLAILRRLANTSQEALLQPKVRVPRFRRRPSPEDVPPFPVHGYGGKRKASLIIEKAREEFENISLPPPPTKPVLDEKEKQRLQTIFEWHGLLEEGEVLVAPKITPVPRIRKGSREEKEQLLDLISKEIEEREEFLRDMQKYGKDEEYRSQIQMEIHDRVKQMKQLDKLITAEEERRAMEFRAKQEEKAKSVSWSDNDL